MSNASVAIQGARAYLNDNNGISWTDTSLMPFLREAFGELQLALGTHRISEIKSQVIAPIAVGDLFFPLPSNITEPVSMFEKDFGASDDFYEPMKQVAWLPNITSSNSLVFWSWRQQQIQFLGATSPRTVKLRYNGYLTAPNTLNDPLGFIWAERFLGPRIAALALESVGQGRRAAGLAVLAENNKYQIMQYNVTENQRPVRRKKYRSRKGIDFPDGGFSVPVGSTTSDTMPVWIPTSTQPDGVRSTFVFPSPVLYLSLDGDMKFPGITFVSVGSMTYSLIDSTGSVIVPPDGSILMGQKS